MYILTIVPHSVTLSLATCFTATYRKDAHVNMARNAAMCCWYQNKASAYRHRVTDPRTGVHRPEPAASQHRTHVIDLIESLPFGLGC